MSREGISLSWPRNTQGIKAAAQRKREAALAKTEAALKKLVKEKRFINFETVAETAGVTRAWLYKQPEIRNRIEVLRAQQHSKQALPPPLRATDESKAVLVAELRKQNKELRAKIQALKQELENAYGQALGFESLQSRNRELERQNQHLLNLLTQSRAEVETLKQEKQVNLGNLIMLEAISARSGQTSGGHDANPAQ